MKHATLATLSLLVVVVTASCQVYDASIIFAHNDYVRAVPFHTAYDLRVGFIEADVFLIDHQILVAHHKHEIESGKTLEKLYLEPLQEKIRQNNGYIYPDARRSLTLMIDLKTPGVPTLDAIVDQLEKYPLLTACSTLNIMISGSVPDPDKWEAYPSFITFDGRPGIHYTDAQWNRIRMISTSFRDHVAWDGSGQIPEQELRKMEALMGRAHAKNKPFRFWATPDFPSAWNELIKAKVDVIVTDDVTAFAQFLKKKKS